MCRDSVRMGDGRQTGLRPEPALTFTTPGAHGNLAVQSQLQCLLLGQVTEPRTLVSPPSPPGPACTLTRCWEMGGQ